MAIDPVSAHSLPLLEAALFAPAFAVLLVAALRDRRGRRSRQKGRPSPYSTIQE